RLLALALVVSGAAGCAVNKGADLPDLSDWDERSRVLAGIDAYEFNGRIGVKTGEDGFNGKLRYAQAADDFSATVGGPLGIGTVRIEGNGDAVRLTDKDGITTELADVEIDLYVRYGWTIPVESLRYWALGIPDPGTPAETVFADSGELRELSQGGWTVTISRYAEAAGQSMPSRLKAENAGTSVRLVIDRWVFR
ncbi:MAG: lipoprotein insertase outer membrane protein LolB, partial [Pseudomonadota bacterium]